MDKYVAILAAVLGGFAVWLFKRNGQLKALLGTILTKEKDLEIKQEIIKNEGQLSVEESKREDISNVAESEKSESGGMSVEELVNDLNKRLSGK